MRREPRPARRAGFSLVELLVVIAILALLAALVAAGIGRVRTVQMGRVTEQTVTKLQLALDKQWKATCDQCRDDRRTFSQPVKQPDFVKMVSICDGDVDRAEALWMFLNLRRTMPQSFAEARTDMVLTDASKTVVVTLPRSATYKQIQNAPAAAGDQFTESAALLYLVLTQGGRGTNFALDDAMQGAQTTIDFGSGLSLPAFKDGYGTHIAFARFLQNPDLFQPPYVRVRPLLTAGNQPIDDPLDPVGRIMLWNGTANSNAVKPAAQVLLNTTFNGRNRMAVVFSAGEDKTFDPTGSSDDSVGYRLNQQGAKGD